MFHDQVNLELLSDILDSNLGSRRPFNIINYKFRSPFSTLGRTENGDFHLSCGTGGCLVGRHVLEKVPESTDDVTFADLCHLCVEDAVKNVMLEYFLFQAAFWGMLRLKRNDMTVRFPANNDEAAWMSRLAKAILYLRRKREIFADYERARQQEGNWGVCSEVLPK